MGGALLLSFLAHCLGDELGDVARGEPIVAACLFDAVADHDRTERAGRADYLVQFQAVFFAMATKTRRHEEALHLCVFVTLWQEKMEAYCTEDRLILH